MCSIDHDPNLPALWVRRLWRTLVVGGLLWAAASFPAGGLGAQQPAGSPAWDDARALDLIARARARRALPLADSALRDYRADARGMVYFYLDSRALRRKVLVKTDQVALEVLWAQPDRAKQRIVGLRDESNLPNRMVYHLDHLTVVQNGFGDVIRLGDGDEVRDVPHPAARGAESVYQYRLSDSLTLRLPGRPEPVQAYEVEVRPRRLETSALIGSVYVDRETADIVRMTFTFTPASYVDPRLDYINISLDNSLWDGRYWLPHEQAVEIRRQVPELDYVAAAVILARFRVRDYRFNETIPDSLFHGYQVAALPQHQREAFPFEDDLYADLVERGLEPPPEMANVRRRAAALVGSTQLSGLPRWRFSIPEPGAILRFNRAEGLYVGGGIAYIPAPERTVRLLGGYAIGAERPSLGATVTAPVSASMQASAELAWNRIRDIGLRPGLPLSLNTVTAGFGTDHLDPFHASGASVGLERRRGSWTGGLQLFGERHRPMMRQVGSAPLGGDDFRQVREVPAGALFGATLTLRRPAGDLAGGTWGGSVSLEAGSFDGEAYARPFIDLLRVEHFQDRAAEVRIRLAAGAAPGAPPQKLFLIGGLNTLPGYDYRTFVGDLAAAADVELSADLWRPWIRGRALLAAGWTDLHWLDDPGDDAGMISPTRDWLARTTGGIRPAAGFGIGLLFDILRVDVARGLDGGRWQLLLSVHPDLWPIL